MSTPPPPVPALGSAIGVLEFNRKPNFKPCWVHYLRQLIRSLSLPASLTFIFFPFAKRPFSRCRLGASISKLYLPRRY